MYSSVGSSPIKMLLAISRVSELMLVLTGAETY